MGGADARPSSIPRSPGAKSSRAWSSGEYKNISFIHEIADFAVDDITAEILAEAAFRKSRRPAPICRPIDSIMPAISESTGWGDRHEGRIGAPARDPVRHAGALGRILRRLPTPQVTGAIGVTCSGPSAGGTLGRQPDPRNPPACQGLGMPPAETATRPTRNASCPRRATRKRRSCAFHRFHA